MYYKFTCTLVAGSALVISSNILAQDTDIKNATEQIGGSSLLNKITIFGDRQGRKPLDVAANITVIGSEELADHAITDMQELVRYEPGIEVLRQTTSTDPFNTFNGFNIRGVGGNRVQMMVDGARLPERIIDGTRDYLDFNFTKQVDIVRGPGSVLWGADALGGIVALETLDPDDILNDRKTSGGEIGTSYNSLDNELSSTVTYAHQVSEQLSLLGGLNYTRANEAEFGNAKADGGIWGCSRNVSSGATPCNELDPTDKDSYRGLAKAVFTPNEQHRFEFTGDYMKRNTDVDFDTTLGLTSSGDIINNYDRQLDLYRGHFSVQHEWDIGSQLIDNLKWSLSYSPSGYERTGVESKTNSSSEDIVENDFLSFSEKFIEFDAQATSWVDIGSVGHTFTWGIDGDFTKTDYQRIDSVQNLTLGTTTESRAGGFNFANAETVRADIFVQDQIEFFDGRLEITPGMRYATYSLDPKPDEDYQSVVGSEPVKVTDNAVLYALGADFKLDDTYSVYAAFNEGFKMPTAQQLYTSLPGTFFTLIPAPDLRPETVKNYDIGFRGEFNRGFFSINFFKADYTDFIQSFYNPPGTSDYTYRNLSTVSLHGIEASAAMDIGKNLKADFSVAWQKGTQKVNSTSDTQDYTAPPLKAVIGLDYSIAKYDFTLGATTTLVSAVKHTDSDNDFKPAGYGLLDLSAKWQPTKNSKLRFGIKNVFDKRYFQASAAGYALTASESVANANPIELQTGPARSFELSYNVKF
ncbi:TonB-dependent hemoglobin/transferrin/lactoferrin family receptor [Gammaproteobacteria bacterium AS21]